jgi:hypothetical protein
MTFSLSSSRMLRLASVVSGFMAGSRNVAAACQLASVQKPDI